MNHLGWRRRHADDLAQAKQLGQVGGTANGGSYSDSIHPGGGDCLR